MPSRVNVCSNGCNEIIALELVWCGFSRNLFHQETFLKKNIVHSGTQPHGKVFIQFFHLLRRGMFYRFGITSLKRLVEKWNASLLVVSFFAHT